MKILITGSRGQLGQEMVHLLSEHHTVYGFSREELDVTVSHDVMETITSVLPDVVVHCAAYTAVDQAEEDPASAFLVNTIGTGNIAIASEKAGAKLIYISTDYVFDGESLVPYTENDVANPLTVYGRSKRAGEQLVQSISSKYFIVRTSWLFGKHGPNFVKTMLKLAKEKAELRVVNDQVGSPTYAADLAVFLSQLLITDKYGMYHASNTGHCSWYEFAKEIFSICNIDVNITPCTSEQFPRPARRPKYSVLHHKALLENGFQPLPSWKDALIRFLNEIREANHR